MMNKTLHALSIILLLIGTAAPHHAFAEGDEPKVKIFGNVYGGGKLAQVVAPTKEAAQAQLIQDDDLATLFTTHADHVYTTYVHLGEKAEVYGMVFGGGMGQYDSAGESAGRVTGQTDVALDGATVWNEIYGGGQMADVRGNTLVHFKKGKAGHNAFGGGLGVLDGDDALPDNQRAVLASADIKLIPTDYDLILNDNPTNLATLKALDLSTPANWMKKTGESFVVFDGEEVDGKATFTHYEFKKARTVNRDSEGNAVKGLDGKYYTETDQFDPDNPAQLFSINHNIYGGGKTASKVEGNTFVHINYGMVNDDMLNFKHNDKPVWSMIYNSIANAQFCVFGGGYGYHTDIYGDANVTMDVQGDGQYKYINEFTKWFANEGKTKYHWDTNEGTPEDIYKAADESTWSHGAPGRSCMDIVGGGYNGKVHGTANVTVGGDVVLRKVYGGGYYASVGNTNVQINSGIFNRVYGGGLIGNVYGKAKLTVGQQGGDEVHDANLHLLVKDAIYGGNDVSGTVGTTEPGSKTHTVGGVTYNIFDPVDDDNHGVRLKIYGGLVLGDVYGAGNGNHPGYGNPNYMEFGNSQHPSENYRTLANAGENGGTHVYKYRPRTARVEMTLQGNAGMDFKDEPQVDKVRIWGRTFGGGNSCNVGVWDGAADDNTEYYSETEWDNEKTNAENQTAQASWHPGDNFQGGGTIEINVGSHVQFGNRNDSHETPNGLFMGSNGEHMITQHLDKEKARYYHQYYDSKAGKYYPGFVVYEDDAETPIKRSVGLKAFKAFINNILTKSDNVHLNIDDHAQDVWMSNFVGGGYRGSMQAATENGSFSYELPEGVTVGHSVVGGAFNAHIIYRVYATEYGTGLYITDANGNYVYQTVEPEGGVKSKAEAEAYDMEHGNPEGTTEYDYIKKLYAEGHEGEEEYKTGYLRYNFDGGILAHDSEMNATNTGSRIHQIHDPSSLTTADFTNDNGYIANNEKALVRLTLKNRLEPMVHEADPEAGTELNVHGGIVYGGCYLTGYVEGDSWVDYDCSLSPLCTDERFFSQSDTKIYDEVSDLNRNNAMNIFGAGYGTDTHSMGDVYLCIKSLSDTNDHPFIYNVFGGANMGTVAGSTNVYYDGDEHGTMLGSLYGGGYKGDIGGNTYVELVRGFLVNVYGGSRQANIGGAAHVWAYDGSTRTSGTGIPEDETCRLIVCNMYGGNDISGTISGTMEATWTKATWPILENKGLNSYIQVSGTNPGTKGFPLVGNIYGGGNGDYDYTSHLDSEGNETNPYAGLAIPDVGTSLLEIDGGTSLSAFGGGNKATITNDAYIFVNATVSNFADVEFTEAQKSILEKKFFKGVVTGYEWDGNELKMSEHHIGNIFGGNNVATMTIQPKWNLKSGKIGNVYSGGNMGDMTYYNALAGTTGHETEPKGLSITVNSDNINIESLYGGCRMSDVKATLYTKDGEGNIISATPQTFGENEYGATVNVKKGHIGNVYGGNDISGYVYNGTKVNLSGSITGNVYGAGNGNYLYAYDRTGEHVTSGIAEVWNKDVNQYVYWIPGQEGDSQLKQIVSLTNARPHVSKAYLNVEGEDEDNKVYIFGSVYCGGNASTIRPMPGDETEAHVKFNIGDNVIVNEVFMGSNGASLKYDANDKDNKYLTNFETVNKLDFSYNMTEADYDELLTMNGLKEDKRALIEEIYPNLLSVYMSAVDMKAMPLGFTEFSGHDFLNTWIGTFCMGGNAGSMMTDQPVDIVFPQSLKFFGRIIGGSKDASFKYKNKWHRGGFRMPLASTARLDDAPTKTKLRMKIRGDWYSRRMNMDAKYKDVRVGESPDGDYLVYDKTDNGVDWKIDGKAWHDGCNVYGGCYQSGDMVGDVEIYIESDMLAYSADRYHTNIDAYTNQELVESNKLNIPVANVYGAGYGPDSRSFGDAYIYMKDIPKVASHHPSVNNIFGGGRNGMLVGNSVIHVHDGLVFKDVVGGSFAAPMYGSSQVTVGYPKFYVCKKSGEYFLDRADKWNEGYTTKGNNKTESVIKNSIKYFEGTYVPCNVYDLITGVKLHGSDVVTDLSSIHTAKRAGNTYFDYHDESQDASLFPTGGWNDVEIRVRGGVYGGGSSLSNSTAAIAGSYTTLASTSEYNHGTDSKGNSSVGYGGNSSIIISDQGSTKDHIKISTENPVVNGVYSGTGGVYGDGRLVFCEGFRAAELNGYGYAEHTPSNPLMLNSLQRLDLLTVNDCCFNLYGDQDFATDELKAQKYSLARIGELRMNSSIAATATYATGNLTSANSRNYIGFYNNIHYLGCIVTNDDFHTAKFHDALGAMVDISYRDKKQEYITNYHGKTDDESISNFKQRNYATARNMVGINSGYCLRVENQYYDGNERKTYYGPIVGVAEVKLLNVQPGEGGGYVYADNIHADIYQSGHKASDATFMNESGNFVFEGVHRPGDPGDEKQYIVDDCLPKGFDDWKAGRAVTSKLPEQHYWYVIGDTYYYNSTLTAYTYKGTKTFNLTNSDPNIIFAGIENGWDVQLNSVKWQGATYPGGYSADLRGGGRDGELIPLSGTDKYKFTLQVGDNASENERWNEDMPRSTTTDEQISESARGSWTAYGNANTTPRFNVQLLDNVNNCPEEHEEEYYNNHLSVPERVKLVIKAKNGSDIKTYNVNLEIVYLQGPSFTGNVLLKNCALPGERIGFSSDGINIKTTDQLPVMGYGWKLVPLKSETYNNVTEKMEYVWDTTNAIDIPSTCYNTAINGSVEGSIPALYSQNHWNIFYTFNAGGETFTVEPTKDEEAALSERMLVVHNYHKMADIATKYDVTVAPDIDPATVPGASAALIYAKALKPGAMIYLADDADIEAFVNYVNADNTTEGMHFYLQNDLTLPAAITKAFAGTLHGNGYSITMPTNGDSLFGDKLTGYVYNLGVPNGTIAPTGTITNSFSKADDADVVKYGNKAYALSHYYTTENDEDNYVHTLYANNDGMGGDWRYALTSNTDGRYLRTAAPNYGNMQTSHNTNHAGNYDLTQHDCLFFGQELAPTAEKKYPVHIDDEKISDSNWRETNRVYRTTGYYQSTTADKFHYNKVAWAMQPTLTAIDFTAENATVPDDSPSGFYGKTDDRPASLTSFSSDHNGTVPPYSNATTGKVTQNLLVYNSGGDAFSYRYLWGAAENAVQYHNILNNGSPATTENFHLVDKQDFCAPIAFNVTNRAWYERKPDRFAESNNSGWEGICLPFTVQKAEASLNGEITHFYGQPGTTELLGGETEVAADYSNVDPAKNFHTLHHEYWLRGLVSVATVPDVSPSGTTATFQRPGDASPLFTQGTAAVNYEYNNTWFPTTYGTNYSGSVAQNNWYTTSHTYTDYKPLEKNIPYIVSFPGYRYYEFDLSSRFYNEKKGETADVQTITFSSASNVTIPVTSDITTAANSYVHAGTFIHVTDANAYGMNNAGTQFVKGTTPTTVLPFRTYFVTSSAPSKGIITIGDTETKIENIDISNHPNDGNDFADNDYLIVKPGYRCIVIESSCDRRLQCHGISGTSLGIWEVRRGTNTFSNLRTGIYIIGGKKVVVK